ncbi:MAG TPA: murein transglycosylase A [Stellaceae bacterium]|nr:murein transglycosylase A [Stellaceae bacterium]
MHPRLGPALALIAVLAACAPAKPPATAPDRLVLTPASFDDLKGWASDRVGEALAAFKRSCARRLRFSDDAAVGPQGMAGKVADWRPPCAAAVAVGENDDAAARSFFEAWFRPYRCANNETVDGLFTGYYEPELKGARDRGAGFETPLMKRPPDLVAVDLGDFRADWRGERIAGRVVDGRLKPYETRAQIEAGALDRLNLAFLWVDDPVAAFFLQIQGSGRVDLPDGSQVLVGFDGQNGWPYVAIGRVMIERGLIDRESATMPGIRAWLASHPAETKGILDANASYVFFREVAGDGPIGSDGVALTPGRSLAVDTKFLPLGAPFWLDAAADDGPIERLLIAQDTGGAIRGPVRGDLFWGHGAEAERRAGTMRARGGYFLLLPKTVPVAS